GPGPERDVERALRAYGRGGRLLPVLFLRPRARLGRCAERLRPADRPAVGVSSLGFPPARRGLVAACFRRAPGGHEAGRRAEWPPPATRVVMPVATDLRKRTWFRERYQGPR